MKLSSAQLDALVNSVWEQKQWERNAKIKALEDSDKINQMRDRISKQANKVKKLLDELHYKYGKIFSSGWHGIPPSFSVVKPQELTLNCSFIRESIPPPISGEEIRNKIILATIDATDLKDLSRITGFKF